jgi:hypothetical protein
MERLLTQELAYSRQRAARLETELEVLETAYVERVMELRPPR